MNLAECNALNKKRSFSEIYKMKIISVRHRKRSIWLAVNQNKKK